jgi:hypothetical protein
MENITLKQLYTSYSSPDVMQDYWLELRFKRFTGSTPPCIVGYEKEKRVSFDKVYL